MTHSPVDERELVGLNRYGPTSARPMPPSRLPRYDGLTIDTHAHIQVAKAAEFMSAYVKRHDVPMFRFANPETLSVSAKQAGDRKVALHDSADRIAVLDTQGIDIQVISPTPFHCYYEADPAIALQGTRMANDGIAEFVATAPKRFVGFGTVTLQDPQAAAAELERCVKELGFKGALILTNVNGAPISTPELDVFYATAERLGAVIFIHPNGFTAAERISRYYLNNTIGNPLETTIALHDIILDGVLERYPALKLLGAHGGGYLPTYAGRIDHAWGARQDARARLPRPPSHYLHKIFIDSVVFTTHQLEYLIRLYGADKIVLGTDYPFDMAEFDPVEHLLSVTSLSAEQRAAVAGLSAAKMLGIEL